jgi:hypothetical protein
MILEYDKFDLAKKLLRNRFKIFYLTKLKKAQNEKEAEIIINQMK